VRILRTISGGRERMGKVLCNVVLLPIISEQEPIYLSILVCILSRSGCPESKSQSKSPMKGSKYSSSRGVVLGVVAV
jgi:hypothetical protein